MSDQQPLDALSEQIAALLREAFPGRVHSDSPGDASALPDVTLAEVAARMQLDTAREGGLDERDARALQALAALRERTLPPRLTPRAVGEFLARLGIAASPRFSEAFAEAAIFLRMGHRQTAHLAALRRTSLADRVAPDETTSSP